MQTFTHTLFYCQCRYQKTARYIDRQADKQIILLTQIQARKCKEKDLASISIQINHCLFFSYPHCIRWKYALSMLFTATNTKVIAGDIIDITCMNEYETVIKV